MAANLNYPGPHIPVVAIPFVYTPQFAADVANAVRIKAPFAGRVVGAWAGQQAIGGSTVFTDIDIDFLKAADSLLSAKIATVDASAIIAGGNQGALVDDDAKLNFAKGDILNMSIDITGGSSPTGNGAFGILFVVRKDAGI